MRKLMIISLALLGVLHAQNGNHIHHLYGVKESVSGLFTLDALDQKTGNSVAIETFNFSFSLGDNYAYRTVNNEVYFVDTFSQPTVGFLQTYRLPELYTTAYQGGIGTSTIQGGLTNICVNPEIDSIFYAYNINGGTLTSFNQNGFTLGFTQGLDSIVDASSVSMVYYDNKIFIAGASATTVVWYIVDALSMQTIDVKNFPLASLYFAAHPDLGLFALGSDSLSQNFLFIADAAFNSLDTIGVLPSCVSCATDLFSYDKNAIVIDSTNQQLIVSRSETLGGTTPKYYLSTFDLLTASLVYEVETPERYSNLIFQKPMPDLVYPGDADHDKDVDMQDLLALGLFYNDNTNGRIEISTEWIGQNAPNSGATLTNGVDRKHADCNGDGQINAIDYDAIALNYNYTHYSDKSANSNCDFPLFINLPNLVKEDEPVSIQIGLDLSSQLAQEVYGITFTLEYDSNFVVVNTMNTQGVNTWFGTEDLDYIQRNQDDYPKEKMDIGVVGIDKLNRNGGGILLNGVWTMEDVVIPIAQSYVDMPLKISNVYVIDFDQNVIDACGLDTVIRVYDKNVGITERKEEVLEVFPNPTAQNFISLAHVDDLKYVELYDMQGRRVRTWYENFNTLDISDFNKGVYFLKAYTAEKVYLNKLVYNKN